MDAPDGLRRALILGASAAAAGLGPTGCVARPPAPPPAFGAPTVLTSDIARRRFAPDAAVIDTGGYHAPGDGGGGRWRRIWANPVHPLTLSDAEGGLWEYVADMGAVNLRQIGARADARADGTRYAGTPVNDALAGALAYVLRRMGGRGVILLPPGDYLVEGPADERTRVLELPVGNPSLDVTLRGRGPSSRLLVNSDETSGPLYSALVRNGDAQTRDDPNNARRGIAPSGNGTFRLLDLALEGRLGLGGTYAPDREKWGPSVLRLGGMDLCEVRGVACRNWPTSFSANLGGAAVRFEGNEMVNIGSDAARFVECPNAIVRANRFQHCDDDAIALHSNRNVADSRTPVRAGLVVQDNLLEDSENIQILGAHTITCSGNVLRRCRGAGIWVAAFSGVEGENATASIAVTGNVIADQLTRVDQRSGAFVRATDDMACITVGGVAVADAGGVRVGDADPATGRVRTPRDLPPGTPLNALHVARGRQTPRAGAHAVVVANNVIQRTLGPVSRHSDWGFGPYRYRAGTYDGPVTAANFAKTGIMVFGDVADLVIEGNAVSGLEGSPFRFKAGRADRGRTLFRNVLLSGNVTADHMEEAVAFDWNAGAEPVAVRIAVESNVFDADPYHRSRFRVPAGDGTWRDPEQRVVDLPAGVNARMVSGLVIAGNHFSNMVYPVIGAVAAPGRIAGNHVYGRFVDTGYAPRNGGVAVPGNGAQTVHHHLDSDPRSATFRALLFSPPEAAAEMPDRGRWVAGRFVRNARPAPGRVFGWHRLTTGDTHIAGRDWLPAPAYP